MVTNNQATDIKYKIGIIGPTRVGKTSMITAMLEEGQTLLAGTNVSLQPVGETKARINSYLDELQGSLIAGGEFNPGAMSGTEEPSKITLEMSVNNSKLTWAILDYPGRWIDEKYRPKDKNEEWENCKKWIRESIVLLVPIDASVAMESSTLEELKAANTTLQIAAAGAVARQWVKGRIEKNEPGLLILVPVKCETYFSDNGGRKDKSTSLFNCIKKLYQPLLKAVREEIERSENKPEILIQYHPIDTIGCVEIKTAKWDKRDDRLEFKADYFVRSSREDCQNSPERCPNGADGLVISICNQIVNLEKNKKRNVINRIWRFLTKEDEKLNKAIEKIQEKPLGQRVRKL